MKVTFQYLQENPPVINPLIDDFDYVMERSKQAGVKSMIVTCGSLRESGPVLGTAKDYSECSLYECEDDDTSPFERSLCDARMPSNALGGF